jgi:hypothetical protein
VREWFNRAVLKTAVPQGTVGSNPTPSVLCRKNRSTRNGELVEPSRPLRFKRNNMGSLIELNDTLRITKEQGFPVDLLNLEKHQQNPIKFNQLQDKVFEFFDKPKARIYHLAPTRVFLVQDINDKWLYWGKVMLIEQTINSESAEEQKTSGKYKIIEIYDPVYQKEITKRESPKGKSYF